jgi:hypothetical protein
VLSDLWLTAPLATLCAIVCFKAGDGLGLDRLFWNDRPFTRALSGVALAGALLNYLFVAFLLQSRPHWPAARSPDFITFILKCIVVLCFTFALILVFVWGARRMKDERSTTSGAIQGPGDKAERIDPIKNYQLPLYFSLTLLASLGIIKFLFPLLGWRIEDNATPGSPSQCLALCLVIVYLAYWIISVWFLNKTSLPSVAVCSLAGVIMFAGGLKEYYQVPLLVVVAAFASLGFIIAKTWGPYTFRLSSLSYQRSQLRDLKDAGLIAAMPKCRALTGHSFPDRRFLTATGKRPLVIVCCSGGGIRAAIWTLRTLRQLESLTDCTTGKLLLPDFSDRLRLIFGASGGMLGATRYVTWRQAILSVFGPHPDPILQIERDGLSRLASYYIFHDIPKALLPFIWGRHRGDIIEDNWRDNFDWTCHRTFVDLRISELQGDVPSLIFSPMMIEDGRRLVFSNLELGWLGQCFGRELKDRRPDQLYSQSAVEFRQLFGSSIIDSFPLLSAVRLNASFPFVMPASSIPVAPRRRVVDAGYYDNYGVGLAADWLNATIDHPDRRNWLFENASGVLVVQIRDGILAQTIPLTQMKMSESDPWMQSVEPLLGPVEGILGFRSAVQLFDNDTRLSRVLDKINREFVDPHFATSVSFELGAKASLTWAMSDSEKLAIANASDSKGFHKRVRRIAQWWATR